MEEILASIRRIIADDDAAAKPATPAESKPAAPPVAAVPKPAPVAPPRPAASAPKPVVNNQEEVDAMLAADDTAPKAPPATAPKPAAPDVLDLTEAMAAPAPAPAANFRTIDGASDVVFAERPASPPPSPQPVAPQSLADRGGLMSSVTMAAVDSAFNSLAHTVLGNNARTLEDLVKEMLRPMLKTWLDDNLPSLVERIVRAEIERVSRGR